MKNSKKLIMNTGFLPLNYKLIQELGIEVGMLLCLLIDKQDYHKNEPFYYTQKSVEKEINMKKGVFIRAKKTLEEKGLIKTWLNTNSTPYFYINDECYTNIEKILGVYQNETGGVSKTNTGCTKLEQGVYQNETGGVPNWNTNNNKEQEQIIKTKNNNKLKEQNNNNKIKKIDTSNEDVEDEIDRYTSRYNQRMKELTNIKPIKQKNSVFDI